MFPNGCYGAQVAMISGGFLQVVRVVAMVFQVVSRALRGDMLCNAQSLIRISLA